jgi:FMN phosphatase YigB (HAD superfamily)
MAHVFVPMIFTVSVVLVDLDDTLIPGVCARDRSVLHVLRQFGAREDVETALAVVREEWRASGLREVAELAGVSSWEALWTGFSEAVEGSDVLEAGTRFQDAVWRSLVPGVPREKASSAFRSVREMSVVPFRWVPSALASCAEACTLWCVTNGSGWLRRRKLSLAGLAEIFPVVAISGDVGAEKADSRFCSHVAELLDRKGDKAVAVVGDSGHSDGALAHGLGARFVSVVLGQGPDWEPSASS